MALELSSPVFSLLTVNPSTIGVLPDLRYASSSVSTVNSNGFFSASRTTYSVKLLDPLGVPLAGSVRFASTGYVEIRTDPYVFDFESHVLADGRILYVWGNGGGSYPPLPYGTNAAIYDPLTFALAPFDARVGGGENFSIFSELGVGTALADGRVLLVSESRPGSLVTNGFVETYDVAFAVFTSGGMTISPQVDAVSDNADQQVDPAGVALNSGGFAILWTQYHIGQLGETTDFIIEGRAFDSTGTPQGAEFKVNEDLLGTAINVAAAGLSDGGFVATWQTIGAGGADADGVRARLFSADGVPATGEFQVNTVAAGAQQNPEVLGLPHGGFVIAWNDRDTNVRAQEFDGTGSKIGSEIDLGFISSFGNAVEIALSLTPDGRVLVTWSIHSPIPDNTSPRMVNARVLDGRGALLNGTEGDDAFMGADTGTSANNVFVGKGGNDLFYGLGGADYGYMGLGADVFHGGDGVDVGLGEAGADTLNGGTGQDYLFGGEANDLIFGDDGTDVLQGEAGDDVLHGGAGGDYFYGAAGNDVSHGEDGNDIFVMDAGDDIAFGGDGQDYFYMGTGNDALNGGAGVDVMLGEAGNDTFEGGLGVDYMFAGPGGAGDNDLVIVDKDNDGVAVVYGFEAGGSNDAIRLVGTGWSSFAQVQAAITDYSANGFSILTLDADTAVWLIGVPAVQLNAADFLIG